MSTEKYKLLLKSCFVFKMFPKSSYFFEYFWLIRSVGGTERYAETKLYKEV